MKSEHCISYQVNKTKPDSVTDFEWRAELFLRELEVLFKKHDVVFKNEFEIVPLLGRPMAIGQVISRVKPEIKDELIFYIEFDFLEVVERE